MRYLITGGLLLICLCGATRADNPPARDLLVAGSNWSGNESGDARRPNTPQARTRPAALRVIERKDASFAAEYTVAGEALRIEGTIDSRGNIVAKAVKVIRGVGWDEHILDLGWTGTVQDKELQLLYANSRNMERHIGLTLEDQPAESAGAKRRRKN